MPAPNKRLTKRKTGASLVPRSFYRRSPDLVAQEILGKLLVRPAAGKDEKLVGRIVEVEAYFGDSDPAAHAFAGATARTQVLFGPPGHAYVYFIYGMYFCLNVSCEPEGRAGSVLVRALEPLAGLEEMARRRFPGRSPGRSAISAAAGLTPALISGLTSGPGRLCQAFGITRALDNGVDFTSPESTLQIRDDGYSGGPVLVTPRIGISKAAERLARYVLEDSKHLSRRR